jgi:hypothetical protein
MNMPEIDQGTLHRDYAPVFDLRAGLMVYIPRDAVGVDWPDTVIVAGCYAGTDDFHIVTGVPRDGLERWLDGDISIQDALPELTVAERLFVQCGSRAFEFAG